MRYAHDKRIRRKRKFKVGDIVKSSTASRAIPILIVDVVKHNNVWYYDVRSLDGTEILFKLFPVDAWDYEFKLLA